MSGRLTVSTALPEVCMPIVIVYQGGAVEHLDSKDPQKNERKRKTFSENKWLQPKKPHARAFCVCFVFVYFVSFLSVC